MNDSRNVVLFLCVANSARSPMAEGIARSLAPRGIEVMSAGSRPGAVNPHAVAALHEIGIDISGHVSKSIESIDPRRVRTVITLCAEEVCPAFLGNAELLHWPFPDPAAARGDAEDVMKSFRDVRDALREKIRRHFATQIA